MNKIIQQIEVPPMSARAFTVARGQRVRIIDVAGGQPGDLVAFHAHDLQERFSQARTRVENRTCRIGAGHQLWTNAQPPRVMLSVTGDTGAGHDLLYTPCCRYALEKRFGVSRDGCLEHLLQALAPWKIGTGQIPDPLNLFFSVDLAADGSLTIAAPRSRPGDYLELRAELDALVAVSTCSVPIAGRANSPFAIEIGN
jgi:uncharacterized protein YcgI (DUF1989 family)